MTFSNAQASCNDGEPPKAVVVGLGNDLISDDGVGVHIARRLAERVEGSRVAVTELCCGGFGVIECIAGHDLAIVLDAIQTGKDKPGTLRRWALEQFCPARHLLSYHEIGFFTAIELARQLGAQLPEEILIFTVEADDVETFRESCTPAVAGAIDAAVEAVLRELEAREFLSGSSRFSHSNTSTHSISARVPATHIFSKEGSDAG